MQEVGATDLAGSIGRPAEAQVACMMSILRLHSSDWGALIVRKSLV